jgi:hypothetical protein
MTQFLPVAIMFLITVCVASLLFVPVTMSSNKSGTVSFYWKGFWVFLALIAGFAGASSTLMLLNIDNTSVSNAILAALVSGHVIFVVVGWFHLSGKAVYKLIAR